VVWKFYFNSVRVCGVPEKWNHPQNCKILNNIYFTIAIEEEDDANFGPSAHEPNI